MITVVLFGLDTRGQPHSFCNLLFGIAFSFETEQKISWRSTTWLLKTVIGYTKKILYIILCITKNIIKNDILDPKHSHDFGYTNVI